MAQAAQVRRKRAPLKDSEKTPEGAFVRLANNRHTGSIEFIRGLANLANPKAYKYSDAQVRIMVATLRKEVDAMEEAFKNAGKDGGGDTPGKRVIVDLGAVK